MASNSASSLEISDITIKSSTNINSIKLSIGKFERNFDLAKSKSKEATLSLAPDRPNLPSLTPLIIKVQPEGIRPFRACRKVEINYQDLLPNPDDVGVDIDKREFRTISNGIEIVIGFMLPQTSMNGKDLRPTTDKIFEICPRFRVLVIGRTGAGKTSLIRHTFGVTEALISRGQVGECNINQELSSSDENKRFVLHDSKGFEPGDEGNFDTVIKFLNDRKARRDVKDQVHAVWLCFSIPVAGDRLFETGAENFLQSLSEGKLGRMPIIAIFTKYDQLVDHINYYGGLDDNATTEMIESKARAKLDELCGKPFREQIVGNTKIPSIAVSTDEGYERTLHELTRLTTEYVGNYLTDDVAVLSAVAQQVSPMLKLEAVIAVGKKRWWQGLASTIKLSGTELDIVLHNIHQDIVQIWNLQDPNKFLDSEEFKQLVVAMVGDQASDHTMKNMATSLSMLGALAGIVSALSGPAAPIVVPIAAVAVAAHWTMLLFKQAGISLQRLMNYIVALTLIMQIVFAITTSTNGVVSRRLIKLGVKTYYNSSQPEIQLAIKKHLKRMGARFDRDAALVKIAELIKSKPISAEDMVEIKNTMKKFDDTNDEPWVLRS